MIRNITGVGEGNGPYIGIHDGFQGTDIWKDFLQGSDRILLGASLRLGFPLPADGPHSLLVPRLSPTLPSPRSSPRFPI